MGDGTIRAMKRALIVCGLVTGGFVSAEASDDGFQLALTPQIALRPAEATIRGVTLGIWSENPQHAFALGIVNGSTGHSSGFSLAFALNYAESYGGVQFAFINVVRKDFAGWQAGSVNISQDKLNGVQTGFVNLGKEVCGVQLGAVNYTEKLQGVQLGAVNIVMDNTWFKQFPDSLAVVFPIVNWSF
jgi:hypothetical protein